VITEGISNKGLFVQRGDAQSVDSSRLNASPSETVEFLVIPQKNQPDSKSLATQDRLDLSIKGQNEASDPTLGNEKESRMEDAKSVVEEMIQDLNEKFDRSSLRLRFGTDQDSGLDYFQLYDRKNGDVIKQFPPEEMLEMVADLKQMTGVIFNQSV
jgi:flagellar protein FlaG